MNYTITLSETEKLAMEYVAYDVKSWIENVAHHRAGIAIEDLYRIAVDKYLENNIQVPPTKEEIIAGAYEYGWVKTAKQKTDEELSSEQ
jgi:hypothetical protein